jgi:tetratricopeptide (TPR) repeat protein
MKKDKKTPAPADGSSSPPLPLAEPVPVQAFFRRVDWLCFGLTTLLILIGYLWTLAPDVTLEDSGELAVGSFYAGVPHPPGYPVWTIYSWLFTVLVPFSNIAWRVALSSAVAAAFACGIIALMVSRGSSMLLESIEEFKTLPEKWERAISLVAGFAAGLLLGFNGFMWSQAVIVEVYTLAFLNFAVVLCLLMRWFYAPHQHRYLYLAYFLFGVCFTNHQTLLLAAIGIEVFILLRQPLLGRDFFLRNSLVYLLGLASKIFSEKAALPIEMSPIVIGIYNAIGIGCVLATLWFSLKADRAFKWLLSGIYFCFATILWALWMKKIGRADYLGGVALVKIYFFVTLIGLAAVFWHSLQEDLAQLDIRAALRPRLIALVATAGTALCWVAGAALNFYMPLASMTNPPMNWGYPRTAHGFVHVLTRGQYDKISPTENLTKLLFDWNGDRAFDGGQIGIFLTDVMDEYSLVYILLGLLPFAFLLRMRRREQSWLLGMGAVFVSLVTLLLVLLNPTGDQANRHLNKVFFASAHLLVALGIGCGLALLVALLRCHFERYARWFLAGGGIALLIELAITITRFYETEFVLSRAAELVGLALVVVFIGGLLLGSRRAAICTLALISLMPLRSILANWANNEQRGHLFGFWYGHDMFTPPFGIYPPMTKNAVLYGGTDPGRFCPTYMIFCESFIRPEQRRDPDFDRRDVYIITQNALADSTYLEYLRAQYNRSTQIDPPFFRELLRSSKERGLNIRTNAMAGLAHRWLDEPLLALGQRVENRRRSEGVYPAKEIHIPTYSESQRAYEEYYEDAQRRARLGQLKPYEDIKVVGDNIQVSGQGAVMAINALLAKNIFDKNPGHEFYIEESFPLDWMYPHLSPYGIILKINRTPLEELTEEMLARDHQFWRRYSERLIGDWIGYDTPLTNIAAFAEKTYYRRNYDGFTGNRKFVRDDSAQKSFCKLRNAIAGLYVWRLNHLAKDSPAYLRMLKEADFAYKQSFAFCPDSPEMVYRYTTLLVNHKRYEDAELVAATALSLDPDNVHLIELHRQLQAIRQQAAPGQSQVLILQYEQAYQLSPTNVKVALALFSLYHESRQTDKAAAIIDRLAAQTNADPLTLTAAGQAYRILGDWAKQEAVFIRLAAINPAAEVWYDLALVQNTLKKTEPTLQSLRQSLQISDQRLAISGTAKNMRAILQTDTNFANLHSLPAFRQMLNATATPAQK